MLISLYGERMETVTVSPKFQVVIPRAIREGMGLEAGERVVVFEKDSIIHMVRVGDVRKLRGKFRKLTTKGLRDEDDRFAE
jgi:AbrB family looped-hinge helix DNA binding protein